MDMESGCEKTFLHTSLAYVWGSGRIRSSAHAPLSDSRPCMSLSYLLVSLLQLRWLTTKA